MNLKQILENVAKHVSITKKEEQLFIDKLKEVHYKRKEFMNQQSQLLSHVAFVVSGCMRSFHLDKLGVEHVLQFAPEQHWISDMNAFISGKPSILNIEALESTEVLLLGREKQMQLFDEAPKFERFFRIITEKSIVKNNSRMIYNMSLTAIERYELFCKDYPSLIHRLSQKHIASYIGVTPEFLSKIKAHHLKKND